MFLHLACWQPPAVNLRRPRPTRQHWPLRHRSRHPQHHPQQMPPVRPLIWCCTTPLSTPPMRRSGQPKPLLRSMVALFLWAVMLMLLLTCVVMRKSWIWPAIPCTPVLRTAISTWKVWVVVPKRSVCLASPRCKARWTELKNGPQPLRKVSGFRAAAGLSASGPMSSAF